MDTKLSNVSITCPNMWPNLKICPKDAQTMSNHANCVQKIDKLLILTWTFVVWHTKCAQTATKCPKYSDYVFKFWRHFGHIQVRSFSKRKVSKGQLFGSILDICIYTTQDMSKLRENAQNMSIMCPKFRHFITHSYCSKSMKTFRFTASNIWFHLVTLRKDLVTSSRDLVTSSKDLVTSRKNLVTSG